jgi:hypothetical protein
MKKFTFLLITLCLINPAKCGHNNNTSNSNNSIGQWTSWVSVSSYPLKARWRREDNLGGGNFAWVVQISDEDLTLLKFSYRIDIKKGDGSGNSVEGSTQIAPGQPDSIRLSAASIVGVHTSDVQKVTH